MTPLHHQIKHALLPVLLENTKKQEAVEQIDDLDRNREKMIKRAKKEVGVITTAYVRYALELTLIATARPKLTPKEEVELFGGQEAFDAEPLSCIYIIRDAGYFQETPLKPYILLSSKGRTVLPTKPESSGSVFTVAATRPATPEEIELCLDELNEYQLKQIMTLDIFAPVIASLFTSTEQVLEEPPKAL